MPSVQKRPQYIENKLLLRITDYISTALHICFQYQNTRRQKGDMKQEPQTLDATAQNLVAPEDLQSTTRVQLH